MIRRVERFYRKGEIEFSATTPIGRGPAWYCSLCSQPKPMPLTAEASARIASCSLPRTKPLDGLYYETKHELRYIRWATLIRLAMCSSRSEGISRDAESEATSLCQPNSKLPPLVDDRAGLRAQDVLAHIVERLGKGLAGASRVLETTVHSGEEVSTVRFAVRRRWKRFGFASKLESRMSSSIVEHPDASECLEQGRVYGGRPASGEFNATHISYSLRRCMTPT